MSARNGKELGQVTAAQALADNLVAVLVGDEFEDALAAAALFVDLADLLLFERVGGVAEHLALPLEDREAAVGESGDKVGIEPVGRGR